MALRSENEPKSNSLDDHERLRPYLLAIANQSLDPTLRSQIAPSDLVQDTFCVLETKRQQLTGIEPSKLKHWLKAVLLNLIQHCHRRYHRQCREVRREVQLVDAHSQDPTPSSAYVRNETDLTIQQAIARLPHRDQTIIRLRYLEDRSFNEIGVALGMNENSTRQAWGRALKRLQNELKFHGYAPSKTE